MKKYQIVLLIALALFSTIRFTSTCTKKQNTKLKEEFSQKINSIEIARFNIFSHQNQDIDSLKIETDKIKTYNSILDSNIEYYRAQYSSDQKRYGQYLKVLYEYKKLYYEFDSLKNLNKENVQLSKDRKEYEYQRIQKNIQSIQSDLESYKLAALWDVFD